MRSDPEWAGNVVLRPVGLSWVRGPADDPADLCAHGKVDFRIGDEHLIHPELDDDVTVSAAALYLMRALDRDHTKQSPVGEQLFPCCGFEMLGHGSDADVEIIGCPIGIDFEVLHGAGRDHVLLRATDGRSWRIRSSVWRSAVFSFCDAVSDFFAAASPKTPDGDDEPGYRSFVAEWERRRGRPFGVRILLN